MATAARRRLGNQPPAGKPPLLEPATGGDNSESCVAQQPPHDSG